MKNSSSTVGGKSGKKQEEASGGFTLNREFIAGIVAVVSILAAIYSAYDSLYGGGFSNLSDSSVQVSASPTVGGPLTDQEVSHDLAELKKYSFMSKSEVDALAKDGDVLAQCEATRREFYAEYDPSKKFTEGVITKMKHSAKAGCVSASLDMGHYYIGTFGKIPEEKDGVNIGCAYLESIKSKNNEARYVYSKRCENKLN